MNLVTLAYLNSLINPILYILINRDVRNCIKAPCLSNENLTVNSSIKTSSQHEDLNEVLDKKHSKVVVFCIYFTEILDIDLICGATL